MAAVHLENIFKRYTGSSQPAVDNVSLAVQDGEFMVLLGPSGCGKSTTLRMIAGLESISEGTLAIDARKVNEVPAKDRDIAMVFQSYALYPHMTVADNLSFGLRRRQVDSQHIAARVKSAADILGLNELLARKPAALSGGQRQRVALGRAIVREPKVFLFDEPLSNLDAALRVNTRNELVRLHQRLGATMIYVTHDQVEAMTMGQRICVMNKGQVAQVGKPLDVYRAPADAFVARFLGNPPMNILKATVAQRADQRVAVLGGSVLSLARWAHRALPPSGDVLVGVRPEELQLHEAREDSATLRGVVSAIEPLGAETLLLVALDGGAGDVMARLHRDVNGRIGDRVGLSLPEAALYLFDGRSEKAIPAGDVAGTAAAAPEQRAA
ncbi:MAG: glycerol-3-phosphate ABC transporter ATP-binding protein [Burkholderiales bacterium PBB5]|nr:MAG: glycerol-3-phosphate ABC transporter ATP-binding protein [Burkholderiales bacterium PBB5]